MKAGRLGYFYSGHFMFQKFKHRFNYKFCWDDKLHAGTFKFFLGLILRELELFEVASHLIVDGS